MESLILITATLPELVSAFKAIVLANQAAAIPMQTVELESGVENQLAIVMALENVLQIFCQTRLTVVLLAEYVDVME